MKHKVSIFLMVLLLLITGCGNHTAETTVPATEPIITTVPETTIPETTVLETTVPPTTEPEIILEAGPTVTTDGTLLSCGTVLLDETIYVNLGEFLRNLDDVEYSGDDEQGYVLTRGEAEFHFSPDEAVDPDDHISAEAAPPIIVYQKTLWVPLRETCRQIGVSVLDDAARNHLYCTSVGYGWDWAKGVDIPVLMYHGVADDTWGVEELFVRPSSMEKQIEYLLEKGYDLITFEDWAHLEDFDKPIMLTFDDGYVDNYEELFPILVKYNVKATIFLITNTIDNKPKNLTSQQIREMQASGLVSFQSHTVYHPNLAECDETQIRNEMVWSKIDIARLTGYEPFVLCYPYGKYSSTVRSAAMEHYRFALAMSGGLYTTGNDVSRITRYYVSRYTSLSSFASMASGR